MERWTSINQLETNQRSSFEKKNEGSEKVLLLFSRALKPNCHSVFGDCETLQHSLSCVILKRYLLAEVNKSTIHIKV